MADDNLTFDDMLFSNSRQASEQQLSTLLGDSKLTVNTSKSPMFPDAPYPTTTVTPVLTPSVNKPEWNYTATLEEAFPDAQFEDTEDDEVLTLMEWLKLQDFESPDEDYRLACLFHDQLGFEGEEDGDEFLMSGAILEGGEEEVKAEVEAGVTKDESEDESKNETKEVEETKDEIKTDSKHESKDEGESKPKDKRKENVFTDFGDSDSEEDSEEDDNDSDDFDETPYGTGIGGGWL